MCGGISTQGSGNQTCRLHGRIVRAVGASINQAGESVHYSGALLDHSVEHRLIESRHSAPGEWIVVALAAVLRKHVGFMPASTGPSVRPSHPIATRAHARQHVLVS